MALLVDTLIKNISNARRFVQKKTELALLLAADQAKKYYNTWYYPVKCQEGDLIYINLHWGYALPG